MFVTSGSKQKKFFFTIVIFDGTFQIVFKIQRTNKIVNTWILHFFS